MRPWVGFCVGFCVGFGMWLCPMWRWMRLAMGSGRRTRLLRCHLHGTAQAETRRMGQPVFRFSTTHSIIIGTAVICITTYRRGTVRLWMGLGVVRPRVWLRVWPRVWLSPRHRLHEATA